MYLLKKNEITAAQVKWGNLNLRTQAAFQVVGFEIIF